MAPRRFDDEVIQFALEAEEWRRLFRTLFLFIVVAALVIWGIPL
jgi:hypothetical protein